MRETSPNAHGVFLEEIEAALSSGIAVFPNTDHSGTEPRLKAIGRTEQGRYVFLVYTIRRERIRPISARYMHRREVLHYEKKLPTSRSEKEAERFVAKADLTRYDLSGGKHIRFEFEKKDLG